MSPEEVALGDSQSAPGVAENSQFQLQSSKESGPPEGGTPYTDVGTPVEPRLDPVQLGSEKGDTLAPALSRTRERENVDGAELLEELRRTIGRFVVLPAHAGEALALWVLHTYAFELRKVSTYIGIASPEKRCGKTTLMEVLSELVNRPIPAANISPSALFRVIEEKRPTLLIDEADTFLDANDEMRGILNSGYNRKGAYVMRVSNQITNYELKIKNEEHADTSSRGSPQSGEGEDGGPGQFHPTSGSRLVRFSTWCPKAIAAIGRLPETLADRCIVITMHRKRADEACERLRELDGNGVEAAVRAFCAATGGRDREGATDTTGGVE